MSRKCKTVSVTGVPFIARGASAFVTQVELDDDAEKLMDKKPKKKSGEVPLKGAEIFKQPGRSDGGYNVKLSK
jgi:hypothetical protein